MWMGQKDKKRQRSTLTIFCNRFYGKHASGASDMFNVYLMYFFFTQYDCGPFYSLKKHFNFDVACR